MRIEPFRIIAAICGGALESSASVSA
jgi:hypothetical protein